MFEFLETLCSVDADDVGDDEEDALCIVDTNAIHLFMATILLPSADFVAAFKILKFMMKHSILMNTSPNMQALLLWNSALLSSWIFWWF